ncbi:hypothetical protein QF035_000061 [Streptomyces umbrinus]|uniref:Uncharacterized protein n=1 Tax=Streptomyces umbrinus TaxID=67370 RepID=A0ABU0SJ37_9ACTN|nr:hypothetical protein [Streptomyces umbrinus]MDQ1022479.1 hypothetical protein [Streptomyces umbrinus]
MIDERRLVTDAHGRPTDLTSTPVTGCRCGGRADEAGPQARHWARAAVAIVAILTTGLLLSVLLLVVRDIAVAVAGSGVTGWLLKVLFASSAQQDR